MRIGIIAHLKYPISKPFMGGLEAFTYDICQRLLARGHDVLLYACAGSDPILNVRPILCEKDYQPITSSQFTSRQLSTEYIATHHAYVELMQDIDRDELDIIFNNSLNYVPIMMSALVNAPMITVLHTPPIFELKNAIRREQDYGRVKYVSVSKTNADNWKAYAPVCDVIHNGIDLESWEFYPENEGGYVMWFGRIHPDKGLHLAIEAAKLSGKKLKAAGAISDQHYYETEIIPRLDDSIELLGSCDHKKLNELIGNAEAALITPCWDEPFGLVVAESLACGTPVAGIAKGALPYLLNEHTGALCDGNNVHELADCIQAATKLNRAECRQRAEQLFDVEKMVDAYEALFEKTVSERIEMRVRANVS